MAAPIRSIIVVTGLRRSSAKPPGHPVSRARPALVARGTLALRPPIVAELVVKVLAHQLTIAHVSEVLAKESKTNSPALCRFQVTQGLGKVPGFFGFR